MPEVDTSPIYAQDEAMDTNASLCAPSTGQNQNRDHLHAAALGLASVPVSSLHGYAVQGCKQCKVPLSGPTGSIRQDKPCWGGCLD